MKARHNFKTDEDYKKYLRIYFAGLAMQSILTARRMQDEEIEKYNGRTVAFACAKAAIEYADELLIQLEK